MSERKPSPPSSRPTRSGRGSDQDQQWLRMVGIGFEFIAAVVLFTVIGLWLDGRWNTQPWLMVAGLALGFGTGLWLMIKAAMKTFHD